MKTTIRKSNFRTASTYLCSFIFLGLTLALSSCNNEEPTTASVIRSATSNGSQHMYVIEREVPGAGELSQAELKQISIESCDVLEKLGTDIEWLHSYVTKDIIFCVFTSKSEALIEEHASLGGFPVNSICQVYNIIDPTTSK